MARKKVVLVIVEGPSDDTVLGVMLNQIYDKDKVYIHIMHGDITTRKGVHSDNIVAKIGDEVRKYAKSNHYMSRHFKQIIHIVDMDGAYIPKENVILDLEHDEISYESDGIHTPDQQGMIERNKQKTNNLYRLRGTGQIWQVPYRVYYMSCNLDHVLHNKRNSTSDEKEMDAYAFAKRYKNDVEGFVNFICDSDFSVNGDYKESWTYIEDGLNSIDRYTNLCICIMEEIKKGGNRMLNMTNFYYFSPTGGTKKAGKIFCSAISDKVKSVDLGVRDKAAEQPESELAVFAAPVFGGRIPAIVAEKLNGLDGHGKKAVTLAVYGNRAYEDALLELNNIIMERGFQVAASAAFVAQHSIVPEVGIGRPDEQDASGIRDFARKVLNKLENGIENVVAVPGNYPYKDGMNTSATPVSMPSCTQCGTCGAACPTGAIHMEDGSVATDLEKCILCMACVKACPEHARILPPPMQEAMDQKLGVLKSVRKENEYFL